MTRTAWVICGMLVAGSLAASGVVYVNREAWLPETVPVHWGIHFEPDRWAAREDMFWWIMTPPLAMMALLVLLPVLIFWLSPRGFEPGKNNPRLISYIVILVMGLMATLHGVILMSYTERGLSGPSALLGVLCVFFILFGNILGKVQRNFWIGIRTPWTLANHVVWEKTHRLGAWMFVGAGVLGLLALLLGTWLPLPVIVGIFIGLIGLAALVPVIYSLVLYKRLEREGRLSDA